MQVLQAKTIDVLVKTQQNILTSCSQFYLVLRGLQVYASARGKG